jgi:hypothetical protein
VLQANFRSAILDGEVLVWNKRTRSFMPFKNIVPVLYAVQDHAGPGTVIKELNRWKAGYEAVDDDDGVAALPCSCSLTRALFLLINSCPVPAL